MDLRDAQREMVSHTPSFKPPNNDQLDCSGFRFHKVHTLANNLVLEKIFSIHCEQNNEMLYNCDRSVLQKALAA